MFNFPRVTLERAVAAAVQVAVLGRLMPASAMHRGTSNRGRPLFPLPLHDVSMVKVTAQRSSLEDFCRPHFASLSAGEMWTALGVIGLNGMAGFGRAPSGFSPTETQKRAIGCIRQSTTSVLAPDVRLDRSPQQAEKELAGRFLSYSGEEVPKMQVISYEAAKAALPPESHGGAIDALNLVSPGTQWFLEHPEESVMMDPKPGVKLQAKVHVAPHETLKFFNLLVERRICNWIADDDVLKINGQQVLNGMFAVGKGSFLPNGEELQRTIMNLVPTNSCFRQIEGATSDLPSICQYLSLVLGSDERVWFYQSDMSSAFYLFRIPMAWTRMMAFSVVFSGEQLGLQPGVHYRPACSVIPMGWHSAVSVMQETADRLTVIGRLPADHKVRRGAPLPVWLTETMDSANALAKPWYHVYLDNFCAMQKGTDETPGIMGVQFHQQLEQAWTRVGVLSSAKKRVSGAPQVEELGAHISGSAGTIGAGPERLLKLIQTTLVVISKGRLSKKWVQVVAGRWVHCMSFRRPTMVMLDATWTYISGKQKGETVENKTRSELFGCCLTSLLIHTNLRASLSQVTTASDASSTGGAVGKSDTLSLAGREFASSDRAGRTGGQASQADRRRARRNIVLEYHAAVLRLAPVLEQVNTESQLDDLVADWVQDEFEDGSPLHLVGDALSGLHYFEPFTKRKLTKSWRLYSIWRRYEVPCRAPPLTQDIVLGMAGYCISICELTMAALLLLGFHCLMRTGELLQIRPCDFILNEEVGLVSIPSSKSGVRQNTRESVSIRDPYTLETVAAMVDLRQTLGFTNTPCWDRSGSTFRDLFRRILDKLEVADLSFRPYSLRRGGATYEMQSHGLMERTLIRGSLTHRLVKVNSVVREGDKVWVKVRDVDEENGKYALDMRFVHQKDGRDLDPFNGRGRVPKDVGWEFPKQQLKHIQAANAVINAQKEGFGNEFAWKKEQEEEEAMKRMQVESSDESDPEDKKAKKMKKKLEKQKQKLEKLKQGSLAKPKELKDSKKKEKEKEKDKEREKEKELSEAKDKEKQKERPREKEKEEKAKDKPREKEKAKEKPREKDSEDRREKKSKKRRRDSSS
eukprot:s1612_g6.t1